MITFSLSLPEPRREFFFPPGVHNENLVGFLEVKATKGWRSPGVSGFHASPLSTSSNSPNLPLSMAPVAATPGNQIDHFMFKYYLTI